MLFQSEDGTIYAAADTALAAVTWGAVVNVLDPTATPFQTDLVNALEIALVGGDAPNTVTSAEMLAGANRAAVIRADGTAEIIHFHDVIATDSGTFVLSTLLRGRRGTEVYVSGHEPGEMFVMLDDSAAIGRRLLPLDQVGKTLHLAAVARGGEAGNSKPQAIALAGNDLKPYAPVHLAASGSFGADITLSWVRRTRVGGDLKDGFGTVLLAEDTEEYELEVLGPEDDARRTVTGLTSPTFTYTAAMQAEDFPEGYPASAARVGTCEGWFVGNHSITGGQTASTPILHVGVDVELAIRLAKSFGGSPETWLKLQMQYDLAEALKNEPALKGQRVRHPAA